MKIPQNKLKLLTAKQLHNALLREYPNAPAVREKIKEGILREKEEERARKIKETAIDKAWAPLVYQAYRAESAPLARIRRAQALFDNVIKRADGEEHVNWAAQEVLDTYTTYQTLVKKVTDKLRAYRRLKTHTPKQLAREKQIPNEGEHWSDWVPQNIKAAFIERAAALPENNPMELFPRTYYQPAKKQKYVPRTKPKKERSLTHIQQLRVQIKAADSAVLADPSPENIALRDRLVLEQEAAKLEKKKEYAKRYRLKTKTLLNEWRAEQKRLEGESE
jgi:hypothetical protein